MRGSKLLSISNSNSQSFSLLSMSCLILTEVSFYFLASLPPYLGNSITYIEYYITNKHRLQLMKTILCMNYQLTRSVLMCPCTCIYCLYNFTANNYGREHYTLVVSPRQLLRQNKNNFLQVFRVSHFYVRKVPGFLVIL